MGGNHYFPPPVGRTFHRWTVLSEGVQHPNGYRQWHCRCVCGREKDVRPLFVTNGQSRSCGCYQKERARGAAPRHGMTGTPEHRAWGQMKQRCTNPNSPHWMNYGGRGIAMDPRFRTFEAFFAYVGKRPSPKHSLGRIDNDGHYAPGNVEWQTRKKQRANQRPHKPHHLGGRLGPEFHWRGRDRSSAPLQPLTPTRKKKKR